MEERLRRLGLVRPSGFYEGVGEPVRVEGVRGEWVADTVGLEHMDDPVPPRMTFLSPFDRLIHDRERTEDLFGFRYRLETYVPAAKRTFGYFALPVLHAERLIGRLDARYDRKSRILRVNAIHPEPGVRVPGATLRVALRSLGKFLGAERIEMP